MQRSLSTSNSSLCDVRCNSPLNSKSRGQWVAREAQVFDDSPADQMFLDDPLRIRGSDVAIPRSLGIHHRDRAGDADAQTLALGPVARPVRAGDVQLLQPLFHVVPCRV